LFKQYLLLNSRRSGRLYYVAILQLNTGIAMGFPTLSIIAEIFLQQLEQEILKNTLESQTITYYTRYVDDIFVICNQDTITPEQIL
jgi:hypothetical protein